VSLSLTLIVTAMYTYVTTTRFHMYIHCTHPLRQRNTYVYIAVTISVSDNDTYVFIYISATIRECIHVCIYLLRYRHIWICQWRWAVTISVSDNDTYVFIYISATIRESSLTYNVYMCAFTFRRWDVYGYICVIVTHTYRHIICQWRYTCVPHYMSMISDIDDNTYVSSLTYKVYICVIVNVTYRHIICQWQYTCAHISTTISVIDDNTYVDIICQWRSHTCIHISHDKWMYTCVHISTTTSVSDENTYVYIIYVRDYNTYACIEYVYICVHISVTTSVSDNDTYVLIYISATIRECVHVCIYLLR